MAHHKKRRSPNQRGHCHMCKWYKDNGNQTEKEGCEAHSYRKRRLAAKDDIKQFYLQKENCCYDE